MFPVLEFLDGFKWFIKRSDTWALFESGIHDVTELISLFGDVAHGSRAGLVAGWSTDDHEGYNRQHDVVLLGKITT